MRALLSTRRFPSPGARVPRESGPAQYDCRWDEVVLEECTEESISIDPNDLAVQPTDLPQQKVGQGRQTKKLVLLSSNEVGVISRNKTPRSILADLKNWKKPAPSLVESDIPSEFENSFEPHQAHDKASEFDSQNYPTIYELRSNRLSEIPEFQEFEVDLLKNYMNQTMTTTVDSEEFTSEEFGDLGKYTSSAPKASEYQLDDPKSSPVPKLTLPKTLPGSEQAIKPSQKSGPNTERTQTQISSLIKKLKNHSRMTPASNLASSQKSAIPKTKVQNKLTENSGSESSTGFGFKKRMSIQIDPKYLNSVIGASIQNSPRVGLNTSRTGRHQTPLTSRPNLQAQVCHPSPRVAANPSPRASTYTFTNSPSQSRMDHLKALLAPPPTSISTSSRSVSKLANRSLLQSTTAATRNPSSRPTTARALLGSFL
jgi:hypothetical protein